MVTRIQMGPAHFQSDLDAANRGTMGQDTSAHHEPTSRVHSGATRITAGADQAEHYGGTVRHTVSHAGTAGGSVAATAEKINGQWTAEGTPGVPGSRTLVAQLIREGVLVPREGGGFDDVKAADGKPHTLQTREAEQQQAREQQAAQEAQEKAAESPTA